MLSWLSPPWSWLPALAKPGRCRRLSPLVGHSISIGAVYFINWSWRPGRSGCILLPAIAAGIVIALLRGGSLRHMAALPLRLGWLAILCLMAQIYVIYSPADRLEVERTLHAFCS